MININGEDWEILLVSPFHPSLRRSDGHYTLGCCDDYLKTIFIADDVDDYYLKKVLSHELTHAAMYSYNIDLSYEQEEVVADLIATYGHEIIHITNWLLEELGKCRQCFHEERYL